MRPPGIALPAVLAAALAGIALGACGDTLVDHRNTEVQTSQERCANTEALCGPVDAPCVAQGTQPGEVCGAACQPCTSAPANATPVCQPTTPHDYTCDYECSPGLLRCAPNAVPGCCAPALVASGGEFSCAATSLADGGEVHCWGAGDQGQLGNGGTAARSTSGIVPGLSNVSVLAAGSAHACATSGGTTRCWGNRAGFGGTGNALAPEVVASLANATALAAGMSHTCAIVVGNVTCLGAGNSGGGTPPGLAGSTQISAGAAFTCALVGGGTPTVKCWGDDAYGQLGTGGGAATATPVTVTVPGNIQHIAAGARHACASNDTSPNGLWCWGDNSSKQLGTFAGAILVPTANPRVNKIVAGISAGGIGTCAAEEDPTPILQCWSADPAVAGGTLAAGEPNHISFGNAPGPVSSGGLHACFTDTAVTPSKLHCFGHNASGQLGNGATATPPAGEVQTVIDR